MSISLTIQADVIDISRDNPRQDDVFLVDTNVWLWQTYTNAIATSRRAPQKIRAYTPYLKRARQQQATLVYSGLILSELAHVIEKTECAVYSRSLGKTLSSKEFRHGHPAERVNVVAEIESAWRQVEQLATSVDLTVNQASTNAALARLRTQALDGYDLLLLEAISQASHGPICVITDDMDYAVVPGLQLFTANGLVIEQAGRQHRLLVRS